MTDLYLNPPCDPCVLEVPWIPPSARHAVFDAVTDMVYRITSYTPLELRGRRRTKYVSRARQLLYWALYEATDASLPQIGRYLNRDHTTVLHGIRRAKELMLSDERFNGWCEDIARLTDAPVILGLDRLLATG